EAVTSALVVDAQRRHGPTADEPAGTEALFGALEVARRQELDDAQHARRQLLRGGRIALGDVLDGRAEIGRRLPEETNLHRFRAARRSSRTSSRLMPWCPASIDASASSSPASSSGVRAVASSK